MAVTSTAKSGLSKSHRNLISPLESAWTTSSASWSCVPQTSTLVVRGQALKVILSTSNTTPSLTRHPPKLTTTIRTFSPKSMDTARPRTSSIESGCIPPVINLILMVS